ncbi:dihydrodipicolinate synthase [Alcanivorax balearicus MACL04]|uniref:4-hydroxy-tetrahydrodipicolinate synthase n=1 Tax=Alloalcanivorax balearicus MACL04 TaxID=1177182 RepID=A0ABT2QVN5_9GAMM|nr:4-hydroxy-tetrahydrodipicolinate synthase [Alloalcanivorax balearicus]MCU5781558.1 dihydrodipicolinate synthase [Alloalcanivorax balearicus MACL04]
MIRGSIVALVTPMREDGSVDWERLRNLVDWHVEQGTHAIVAVGTTGESATLGFEEHDSVIREVVAVANKRIPVIAGTGANNTEEAIRLTRDAKRDGADACLLVTPYYNKPPQEGLYQHFLAVARAVDIPQILYNVPGRTSCDLLPETVERLCRVPNIVGIKEATGNLERAREIRERCGPDFMVYSGDDATACELMLAGGDGNISVTANVVPAKMARLCDAALSGDADGARALNAELEPLNRDLFIEANPIPVKWALYEMGMIDRGIRLPLVTLSEAAQPRLRETLRRSGLLEA